VGVNEQLGGGFTDGWGQPTTTCYGCGTAEDYKPLKFPLDSLIFTSEFDLVIFILFYFSPKAVGCILQSPKFHMVTYFTEQAARHDEGGVQMAFLSLEGLM